MGKLKEIIGFRGLGFISSTFLLELQYSFGGELTALFHFFPNFLILTYLADMGYSEYITKSNSHLIHYSFIRRNFLIFLLIIALIFGLKDLVKISYLLPLLIVPIQAFLDSIYRIILKIPNVASKFFIFQAVQPLLLYFGLKVVNLDLAWPVFLILNILIPVIFLIILQLSKKFEIKISSVELEYSVSGGFFIYKVAPLLIYLFLSLSVNVFPNYLNECYMVIRIAYFIMGIILLFLYSGGKLTNSENNNFFKTFAVYSLLVLFLFIGYSFIKGYSVGGNIKAFSIYLFVIASSSACFSFYIIKYTRWLKTT